jgi:signal transduction histidine kinase
MPGSPRDDSRRSALRVWVPVAITAFVQLATTFGVLAARGLPAGPPWLHRGPRVDQPAVVVIAAVLLALLGPALLIRIRRRPAAFLIGVALTAVAGGALLITTVGSIAFYASVLFAIAIAVRHGARGWAWGVAGVLWLTPIALYLVTRSPTSLFLLVPWTVVSILVLVIPERARNREVWRERRRAEEAQAERVRIARELHDVLAHSLSQINVQASVGLHLFDTQPEKAAAALANVKNTSKQALGEVRQVLGMLRGDEAPLAPEHELAGIRQLVDGARAQGLDASLSYEAADAAGIGAPVQQAAYRIVQEALTNVTKHARARRVTVAVDASGGRLRVSVVDDGVGGAAIASPDGRGLLGMRERAELLGGTFTAGPRTGGGFEVTAELPVEGAA